MLSVRLELKNTHGYSKEKGKKDAKIELERNHVICSTSLTHFVSSECPSPLFFLRMSVLKPHASTVEDVTHELGDAADMESVTVYILNTISVHFFLS